MQFVSRRPAQVLHKPAQVDAAPGAIDGNHLHAARFEGAPAIALGLAAWLFLPDRPAAARFLSE